MSEKILFKEYKFKFYLNANHYIIINGKEGQNHPHTWEFMIDIMINGDEFVQFDEYEKNIEWFLGQYQNSILNEKEPFDVTIPTLENMTDYFAEEIKKMVNDFGGHMVRIESSETPTRSYVIDYENELDFIRRIKKNSEERLSDIIDGILDGILKE